MRKSICPKGTNADHGAKRRWIKVDSYIVDPGLFKAAQERLESEGRDFGYGVHRAGRMHWDGRRDSFSQFVSSANSAAGRPYTTRDYGVYSDVGAFYSTAPEALNRLNWLIRLAFPIFAHRANAKIDALQSAPSE